MTRVRIQIVLYRPDAGSLGDLFGCLAKLNTPEGIKVEIATGDCSEEPQEIDAAIANSLKSFDWQHTAFGENLGFGAGHNRLWEAGKGDDFLLLMNPDCYYPKDLLLRFARAAEEKADFGILEARQIPLEHPKKFDHVTGETNWASGCCACIRGEDFDKAAGFDPAFFLYGEDVDLSWRIAGLGHKLYYCPEIFVYHRKHLQLEGMAAASTETKYSALAGLLLLKKYGQEPHLNRLRRRLAASMEQGHREALDGFKEASAKLGKASEGAKKASSFGSDGQPGARSWEYVPASFCRPDRKFLLEDPPCS